MPNKQFGQLINISPHSSTILNTTNTEFSSIEVWFTGQNSEPLEIEDNVNMTLIIGQTLKKLRFSTEPKYRKYVLSFAKKIGDKYNKKLMDTATKTGRDAAKTASKRVVQKTAEATGDLIRNKIVDKITSLGKTKSNKKQDERQEIYIPPEKRQQITDNLRCFDTI